MKKIKAFLFWLVMTPLILAALILMSLVLWILDGNEPQIKKGPAHD